MTSPTFLFCLTCLLLGEMAEAKSSFHHQERGFRSAKVGESLTLECFYENKDSSKIYWYKQSLGQKPRLVSTHYAFRKNGAFHDEFRDNPRLTLDTGAGENHLKITDLRTSDSATYYCAINALGGTEFAEGITVSVNGLSVKITAVVHQSESETILNCTVQTGTCDDEHSVYWFKDSKDSHPGLIYTHAGRNDQCKRKPNTQTHTCVYNLPTKSLNLSHSGTYYCAVVSCGRILFGDGIKLGVEEKVDYLFLVYFLSGALAFTTILVILLTVSVYKMNKRSSCQATETQARFSAPSTEAAEGYQVTENLHYAALNVNLPNRSRRQMNNPKNECVYSSVKL